MGIDASIIAGLKPVQIPQADPIDQFSKSMALKGLLNQNQIQNQAITDDQATRDAYQQAGGDNDRLRALLMKGGQYKSVQTLDKFNLDQRAKNAEIQKNEQEVLTKAVANHRDELANVTDPQGAAQWIAAAYKDPILAPVVSRTGTLEQALAKIPQDPQAFEQWKQQSALGASKFIEMNKPHITTQNLGGTEQLVATPGLGGAPTVLSSILRTQSPDSVAADARARETLAESVRNHNMTDRRTRELQGSFGGQSGDLLAALAEKGVSIPAGMRSRAQIATTLDGLIKRNPGKSADEIAELVKSGQIGFGAEKKETQTAAAVAGRVGVAGEEIEQFAPLVEQASKAVPRGKFVPVSRLLQTADASLSDPNLKTLKANINAMMNAYDLLASRGGTDKDKRAEAHALLTSAESPEALMAGVNAFKKEVIAARNAADIASRPRSERDQARKDAAASQAPKPAGVDPKQLSDAELKRELGLN